MRAARSLAWMLLLVAVPSPSAAQVAHSPGSVDVMPSTTNVLIQAGEEERIDVAIEGRIQCPLTTAPHDLHVEPSRTYRIDFAGEERRDVWRLEPEEWEFAWEPSSAPGEYHVHAKVALVVFGHEEPFDATWDIVQWRGAWNEDTTTRCNLSYGWIARGPSIEIRSASESVVEELPGAPMLVQPPAQSGPPSFVGRSEVPLAARASLGAAVAIGVVLVAAAVALRLPRAK